MAHYNLYESLGLDRAKDPATIAGELDERINSGVATNPGGMEELQIARNILGDPQRRSLYDQKLDDDNAPDINIAALRDLSNANLGGGAQSQPAPQGESAFVKGRESFYNYSKQAQERLNPAVQNAKSEIARSSKGVIAGTAIVTALAMLLIFGLFSLFGGDRGAGKAEKVVNEFVGLRTNEETERWLIDNASGDSRADLLKALDVNDGFSGVDNYLGASDPKAGDAMNLKDFMKFVSEWDEETYYRALNNAGAEEAYVVQVLNGNGSSAGASVIVNIEGGKARIADLETGLPSANDFDYLF